MESIIQFGNNNWLVATLVGVILAILLPLVFKSIVLLFRLLSKDQLEGVWYNHFFSYDDKTTLFKVEIMRITKGFNKKFSVTSRLSDNPKASYRGNVKFEKDFLILELSARKHDENVYCRFPTPPILTQNTILTGLSLAQDFSGYATSAVNILAREKHSENEILTLINERAEVNQRNLTLKVTKRQ